MAGSCPKKTLAEIFLDGGRFMGKPFRTLTAASRPPISCRAGRAPMTKPPVLPLDGVHVLIVEDHDDTRYILGSYLRYCGALVTVARDGREALDVLNKVRAHVIVSDIQMPGLDGQEFIRRVRELPGQRERPTPAIAVTALSDLEHRLRAMHGGFQVFLVKPVDPLVIVQEIDRLYRAFQAGGS